METGIKHFWLALKDLCFPPHCLACGQSMGGGGVEFLFCAACGAEIELLTGAICRCCGLPLMGAGGREHLCGLCLTRSWHFSLARSLVSYQGSLARALKSFKYSGKTAGLPTFAGFFQTVGLPDRLANPDLILPVPLHLERLRQRGFNQALVLARAFFPDQKKKIDPYLLVRWRPTAYQSGLKGVERRKNIKNAFRLRLPGQVRGKKILLVDDVFTTGSTVDECARILRGARAREVGVLTLARVNNRV